MTSLIDALLAFGDVPLAEVGFPRSKSESSRVDGERMKGTRTSHELEWSSHCSVEYITNDVPKKRTDFFYLAQRFSDVLSILLFDTCTKLADDESLRSLRAYPSSLRVVGYDHLKCPMIV